MQDKLIAYYRTGQRGRDLDLDSQIAAVEEYVEIYGAKLVGTYHEGDGGGRSEQPELTKAIAHASRINGWLVIARLGLLSRSTKLLAVLAEYSRSRIEVAFCDLPSISPVELGHYFLKQMAHVAETETKMVGDRTRAALAAYKSEGRVSRRIRSLYPHGVPAEVVAATAGKLGASLPSCRNLTPEARTKGAARSVLARESAFVGAYAELMPLITRMRRNGATLRAIADRLNKSGHATRRGKPWNATQVMRVLDRFEKRSEARRT